jgi:hypothetical protein
VHFDLWWNELRPRLRDQYWERSVAATIAGERTRVLSPEDQLLLLCVHLHRHGYSRLIWFSDLARLLDCNPHIEWDYVVEAAAIEGVGLSLYFSLTFLEQFLGVATPAMVRERLRPRPIQAWLHQRLWPPSALMARGADHQVDFGFDEVPRASELLLNLLLTGRRWEKALYLGRLLVPSREWLAYYYDTTDPAMLRRRRLIHAPKLLAMGLQDLTSVVFRHLRTAGPLAAARRT